MQGVQIDPKILEAIFIDQSKFQPALAKQIITWNQQLEPSVNMTQSIISSFLMTQNLYQNGNTTQQSNEKLTKVQIATQELIEKQQKILQRIKKATQDIPKTIHLLHKNKCPKNFIRAYLLFIKKNYTKIEPFINKKYILQQWKHIPPQLLESYCDAFSLAIQNYSKVELKQNVPKVMHIKAEQFDEKINELINKKDYTNCMGLIKMSNCQKNHINKLLSKMTNNRQASKAADYIKALKLNPADYPALGERLYKNTARHFLTKNGWEYAQQIFQTHPQALACVIEDLIFKQKSQEAISIWYRNQPCRNYIVKEQTLEFLKPYIEQKGANIKPQNIKQNFLHKDQFGPQNKDKYITLEQFGIGEEQVIWVSEQSKDIQHLMKEIITSQILGIDTQSIVGQTKFDKSQNSKFQQAALIQIATREKVFLFDGLKVKHNPLIKNTILQYIKRNGLIVGHTLQNDMQCLLKSLGCEDQQIKTLKSIRVIDVCKLFKSIHPQKKFSSLAFITQTMLGKELCKDQTLTNWQRRPLRRNQIHYAAMDAYIVIKIYDKFVQQVGQQMIEFYSSMDANQF